MTLRNFIQNRSLQEDFISSSSLTEIKSKVYEVLKFAEETMNRLNTNPTEDDQYMQDFSLRCLFFLLNQIAERRMKAADIVEESKREESIAAIKDDFWIGFVTMPAASPFTAKLTARSILSITPGALSGDETPDVA